MEIVPYVSNRNVRLINTSLSPAWPESLQSFPLGAHADAVDATVMAVRSFIALGEDGMCHGPDILSLLRFNSD